MFGALALHLHGNDKYEEETSKKFNPFLSNCKDGDPSKVHISLLHDFPKFESFWLCDSIFFCKRLVSLKDKSLVSLVVEVFKSMIKVSNFHDT